MKQRLLGWLWLVGAVTALILVQALDQAGSLAGIDRALNRARPLVPALIGAGAIGAILLLGALAHGIATEGTWFGPAKIAGRYRGRDASGLSTVGFFRGSLLGGVTFYQESGLSDVKRSWGSGQWWRAGANLRATLVLAGLPLVVVGVAP